jgi:hypothetical protein
MFSFPPVTEVGGFKTISVYKAAQDSDEPLQ